MREDAAVTSDPHGKLIYQLLLHLLCRLLTQKKRDPEQDQQNLSLLICRISGNGNILLEDTLHSASLSRRAGCLEYSLGAAGGPAHSTHSREPIGFPSLVQKPEIFT
jgi:hypothetical protein